MFVRLCVVFVRLCVVFVRSCVVFVRLRVISPVVTSSRPITKSVLLWNISGHTSYKELFTAAGAHSYIARGNTGLFYTNVFQRIKPITVR